MAKRAPASELLEQIDRLDTQLVTLQNLARFLADVTGDVSEGACVQIETDAICGTMGFFADEIELARGSLRPLRGFVRGVPLG